MTVKIATWNVNSINVRLSHILAWLQENPIAILALQETKAPDFKFPHQIFVDLGYHVSFVGQKSYNGVAIISTLPITDVQCDIPNLQDESRRILAGNIGPMRIINLYVPNGESLTSTKYVYKLDWLDKVTDFVAQQLKQYPQLVVLGDFNIAPTDQDVHDPQLWQGHVLTSPMEREKLTTLLNLGLVDTYRLFPREKNEYSWWDYRAAAFRRNNGLRIDLILASTTLAQTCSACTIDKTPRGWESPSDHTPVIASFTK